MKYSITIILLILLGALVLGQSQIPSSKADLNERDRIIANLKRDDEPSREKEVARIKEIRRVQIDALLQIIKECQQDIIDDYPERDYMPLESAGTAIKILGEIRASEALEPLIDFICLLIDRQTAMAVVAFDHQMAFGLLFEPVTQDALVKIGNCSTPLLIKILKGETVYTTRRIPFLSEQTDPAKQYGRIWSLEHSKFLKTRFVKRALYLIEKDLAIYHLEKALAEETDAKKKEEFSKIITEFKEEIRSGLYKDPNSPYRIPAPK